MRELTKIALGVAIPLVASAVIVAVIVDRVIQNNNKLDRVRRQAAEVKINLAWRKYLASLNTMVVDPITQLNADYQIIVNNQLSDLKPGVIYCSYNHYQSNRICLFITTNNEEDAPDLKCWYTDDLDIWHKHGSNETGTAEDAMRDIRTWLG